MKHPKRHVKLNDAYPHIHKVFNYFNSQSIIREESSSPVLEEEASIEIIDDDSAEPAAIVVEDEEVGIFFKLIS